MKKNYLIFGVLIATLTLIFPVTVGRISDYFVHVAILCFYYVLVASSWNLVLGYTGQVSFAQAGLSGLGAYTSAFFVLGTGMSPFIGMLVGGIVGAAVSFVVGIISLRLRGFYFALVTIALSETTRLILTIEWEITRGALGLYVPSMFKTTSRVPYYYVIVVTVSVSLYLIYKLVHSYVGLFLRSIREDEDVASIMGVDTVKWKTYIFAISGFLTGIAGGFFAHYTGIIVPDIMLLSEMFIIVSMVVIGGIGTFIGPIVGAFLIEITSEYIRGAYGQYHLVIFALVLMVTLRYARGGLFELSQRLAKNLQVILKS